MSTLTCAIIGFIAVGIGLWLVSFLIEGLRVTPKAPGKLRWAPDMDIKYADLNGVKVRYIETGNGPPLVLLHTLRTQLDIFETIIPALSEHFTVYAPDYPGHGYSDIPNAEYAPDDFYGWIESFLEKIDVKDATIAGVSIGGTIALELATRKNPRISKVVSVNPFDYRDTYSSGLKGSSFFAKIMFTATSIPFIGETFMRLRNPFVERKLFEGGVTRRQALSKELYRDFARTGNRKGHYRAFISLLRQRHRWQEARGNYHKVSVPTLLIYGENDWASHGDRAHTAGLIPDVQVETIQGGGHFLSLDRPDELTQSIVRFASA